MQTLRSLAVAIAIAIPASASAQTVDDIVAKHIAARGGMDKLKAIETLKITRTVATGIGSPLKVVIFRKRPQLMRVEQQSTAPGAPVNVRGVNGDTAWDTGGGKTVLRPAPLAAETRDLDADFDGLLVDWKAKGHTVTLEGKESLVGADALKLKVATKSGAVRIVYLDATTYLERRHTGVLNLPGGRKFDVVIDFDNWRDVNGVKFPFDITEERTSQEPVVSLVTYTEKIEANVPMEDALFAAPKG
jgi:hypothetical protein